MRKESIMIKIKPVVAVVSLISFSVLMIVELANYFAPVIFTENNDILRLAAEMLLLAIAAVAAGGRQPRWWRRLKRRRLA